MEDLSRGRGKEVDYGAKGNIPMTMAKKPALQVPFQRSKGARITGRLLGFC
jgi:hypothetical protein